ncbi:flagellar hook-associated protein FlgK [Bacillus sp. OG2]|nr:flagellar hook-associated protein FlgK [Bacillus sp. OG2]
MVSTFHGLETAKRGMFTQQNALYVTGHNIANANTPGYSRQRVNFVQTDAFPAASINRAQIPGQIGTGVKAGSIERIRESFLDIQYRGEQNKLGYWESRATSLSKMEDIMNEPSDNGLSAVMGEFWQSLQDLSTYPEKEGTRQVVLERGQAVVDTFHFQNDSLSAIRADLGNEISVNLKEVNSLLKQIGDLNQQIGEVEPHGYLPNDLYDQRDLLVDQLSKQMNIKVEKVSSGGQSLKIAEGQYNISMVNADGTEVSLVTKSDYVQIGFEGADGLSYDVPESVAELTIFDSQGRTNIGFTNNGTITFSSGKLRGLIESYGYNVTTDNGDGTTATAVKGIYPDMLDNLDKLAFTFGSIFNEVHSKGYNLEGDQGTEFFTFESGSYAGASKGIGIAEMDPKDIAVSTKVRTDEDGNIIGVDAGDGKNALNLSNISSMLLSNTQQELEGLDETIDLTAFSVIGTGTINTFYEGMTGQLGVDALQANRLTQNSQVLSNAVEKNRQSVSSVSLDEEMTNLIKFQHAYNAAARQITILDEILDKVINGMGVGGR